MKQFDEWNTVKKHVENRTHINIKEGQIYYAYLGENIGYEQSGKGDEFFRPNVTSVAILSQIRLMDTKRLYNKIGRMKKIDFDTMKGKFLEIVQDGKTVPEP